MAEQPYEQYLMDQLQSGKINDREINEILDSGDRTLKNALERRADELHREKEHIHRLHGDAWDFRDEKGRLCKDNDLDINAFS
jgi:hypothetical protein